MRTDSPLRYPGGKSAMTNLVAKLLRENRLHRPDYAEPYAGGSGLALGLLFGGFVDHIHLNDIDPGIWSFWHSVLENCDALVEMIESVPVTVSEWQRQRTIVSDVGNYDSLTLGFATFYLNRTNRSGIIKGAGVIGGLNQTGKYTIDCRYNRPELIRRIRRISKYKSRIHLYNMDAISFLNQTSFFEPSTFFAIDPPYYSKGQSLYTSFYTSEDHAVVAGVVQSLQWPWIVTYDLVEEVKRLYSDFRQFEFDINYSVQTKRIGTELLIASKGLRIPQEIRSRQLRKRAVQLTN